MWTKKTTLAALLSIARFWPGVEAKHIRRELTSKSAKTAKTVCLEFGLETDVVAAGSPDPIGAAGKTGVGGCLASPPSAPCCAEATACYLPPTYPFDITNAGCLTYLECLQDPANGPVLVGDWWLQRDVFNGEMFFEEDAVCGRISSTELNSRTRFELWNDFDLGKDLGLFKKFTVDYDVRSATANNNGYLNMYLRVEANTEYYDCRLDFLIPDAVGTGTLVVTLDTEGTAVPRLRSGVNPNAGTSCNNAVTTLRAYLAANPDAVMGVGNGELYTFALNTGSTNENNSGQEVCWSNASVQRYDESTGEIIVTSYEFTIL